MSKLEITIIDDAGQRWSGQTAVVKSTSLGTRDRGVMSLVLHLEGHGWGVGAGGMVLDDKPATPEGERTATAYGMDLITQVLRTVGVDNWEQLPGAHVIALHDHGQHGWGSMNRGIASIDGSRVLVFKDHSAKWHDTAAADSEATR